MICAVINGPSYQEALYQIEQAKTAHLVELRLDYFTEIDLDEIKNICQSIKKPKIFTLRSKEQGGKYQKTEIERLQTLKKLATLQPEYLDLEYNIDRTFFKEMVNSFPDLKIIISYHNFLETPKNLGSILGKMQAIPAHFYKLAVQVKNILEACFVVSLCSSNVIAIGMGYYGQMTRILGCKKAPITYACVDEDKAAFGQLSLNQMVNQYHCDNITPNTKIYGLLGEPIESSVSDVSHNELFFSYRKGAIYLKLSVDKQILKDTLYHLKKLDFQGLSITMPLKEAILPFLDNIDIEAKEIGAVNTIVRKENQFIGYNTDGVGALNAIERHFLVKNKKILIIGAGGAAKAIAYEANKRGAFISVLNRTISKAKEMAKTMPLKILDFDSMPTEELENYCVIINCTPLDNPLSLKGVRSQTLLMDINTKNINSTFLKIAKIKNCKIVYGYEMFVEQALAQFCLWFGIDIPIQEMKATLTRKVEEILSINS